MVKPLVRAAVCVAFASLPIAGLLLFLNLTGPAIHESVLADRLSDAVWKTAFTGAPEASAHFNGVSAELASAAKFKALTAHEAGLAFSEAGVARLPVGFETVFVTSGGERLVLRIVARERITDQPAPDNDRLMNIAPASTARAVRFAWGQWRYTVEIVEPQRQAHLVVQKSL